MAAGRPTMSTDPAPASERPRDWPPLGRGLCRVCGGSGWRTVIGPTGKVTWRQHGACGGRGVHWGRAYLATLDEPARPQAGGEGDGE